MSRTGHWWTPHLFGLIVFWQPAFWFGVYQIWLPWIDPLNNIFRATWAPVLMALLAFPFTIVFTLVIGQIIVVGYTTENLKQVRGYLVLTIYAAVGGYWCFMAILFAALAKAIGGD